ncbi:hypothetical protein PR048_015562 [Dryococelus australis]|uniref:Uncharacterized protein n=1 Tax=Dryococelus australis TaxID=614101 RepID=A0ABQ9HH94_9NEOP|nr:hypothetical protein PR048_015562 [Dryococelus australis]
MRRIGTRWQDSCEYWCFWDLQILLLLLEEKYFLKSTVLLDGWRALCLERALLLCGDIKKLVENSKAVKTKTLLNVGDQTK